MEYDIVLISLEMILHRIAVYRHLLYNLRRDTNEFAVRIPLSTIYYIQTVKLANIVIELRIITFFIVGGL